MTTSEILNTNQCFDINHNIVSEFIKINTIIRIDLSMKGLTKIPENIKDFKYLERLFLNSNKIIKIENLEKNINLEELWIYSNYIDIIENLDNNINLKIIILADNHIVKIEGIDNLNKL